MSSVYLFGSVHAGLQFAHEVAALNNAIKTPTYSEPTPGSTDKGAKSQQERTIESVWIMSAARRCLQTVQMAWVTCTYDGAGEPRRAALKTIVEAYAYMARKQNVLEAVFEREFVFGESWCESLPAIAKHCGCSQSTAERTAAKVMRAMHALGRDTLARLAPEFERNLWAPEGRRAA